MSSALDSRIAAKLDAFARRRRRLIVFRGVCAGLAMLGASMMVVAALDWIFMLPDWLRWTLSGIAYATVILVAWRACVRLLLQVPDSRRLARLIEVAEPSLREELLSAVELGQSSGAWDSEQFRELVQEEVSMRIEGVQVERLLPAVLLRSAMVALAVVVALCLAALVLPSLRFGTLLARAFAPGANLDRVSSVQVRIIQPTPAEMAVPQGDSVPLLVELTGRRVTKAYLETFTKSGGRDYIQLQPAPNGRFSASIQVAREDVEYRVRAFDAITRKYRLQAAPRPSVVKFHKLYRFPAYTGMEPKTADEEAGDLTGVEGTEVDLSLETDQPVKSAGLTMQIGSHVKEVPLERQANGKLGVTLPLKESGSFRVELVAAATGFENKFSPEYELRVSPDTIPQVTIEAPLRDLIASANEVISITATASDDIGLARVEQYVRINDGRWSIRPINEEKKREVKLDERWDLFQQGVKPGDTVLTKLVAIDCKGNRGESRPLAVTIAAAGFERQRLETLAAERQLLKEFAAWRGSLQNLEKPFAEARQRIENTPDDMAKRKAAISGLDSALDDVNTHTSAVQIQLATTLRLAAPGHESANLVLLAREVSRAATSLAFLPNLFQGTSLDLLPAYTRDLMGEAGEVTSRSVQRGRVAEEQQRSLAGAEELDVINENLQVIAREQDRISAMAQDSGDDAKKWASLAGRMKVVLTEVTSTEEQMKEASSGYGAVSDRLGRSTKRIAEPRGALTTALAAPVPGRDLVGPALNLTRVIGETWKGTLDLKRDTSYAPKNAVNTLYQEVGTTWDAFEKLHQEVENALRKEKCPDDIRASLAAGRWESRAAVWKAYGDAEELRLDADAPFVNDLRSVALALEGSRDALIAPGEAAAREPIWKRLGDLDQAFRVLEPAHELSQLATGFDLLASAERWQTGGLRSRTSNVTDWNRLEQRFRAVPGELGRGNLNDEAARKAMRAATDLLNRGTNDPAMRNLTEEMQQRTKSDREPVAMTGDAEKLATIVREALALLRSPIENARKAIVAATPKLPERMAQLAKEAEKLKEATEENAKKTGEKPPEEAQAEAKKQMAQQQDLNKKLDTVKDAIRSLANMQNVLENEGRERARDADDALAMLKEPPVRAEQALSEASNAERPTEQKAALEAASKEDAKLAAALNQLSEHYDALEKGEAEKSRLALREAEKDLGLKEQMDRAYAKADELAQTAQSSPEEMLAKLEQALPKNPLMRQELSSVSKDLLQKANAQLAAASSQENAIARDVDKLAAAAAQAAANAAKNPDPAAPNAPPAAPNAPGQDKPQDAGANPPKAAAPADAANPAATAAADKPGTAPQNPGAATPPAPAAPNPALAKAAEKQAPIANGAAEAGTAVERAGRHEERLQNAAAGEKLQKLGADVQATAQNDVPKAQEALSKAQAPADAQAPVATAQRNLEAQLARLSNAQAAPPSGADSPAAASPSGESATPAGSPPPPGSDPSGQAPKGSSPTTANSPPTPGAASPGAPPPASSPAGQTPPMNANAQGKPNGTASNAQPAPGTAPGQEAPGGQPESSAEPLDQLLAGGPAAPQQQVWMARALDALDAALHMGPPSAQQQPQEQGQGQGQGKPEKGPGQNAGQKPSPSDAMQQAQKAMAAAGQAAAAEMRAGRNPAAGQPTEELDKGEEVAASKTGALADTAGKAHGTLPASAAEAVAKGTWGKLPKKMAEQLSQGQRETVSSEYQKEVETYYRVIAERARKEAK